MTDTTLEPRSSLPPFARAGHAAHSKRCLGGLPSTQLEVDASRLAVGFYCLGTLDLLGMLESSTKDAEREDWRRWIWEQQQSGEYGTGFKPSSYMTGGGSEAKQYSEYNTPHLIMTYTALLSLAILRDDFSQLDKPGVLRFLRSCQRDDGSFTSLPTGGDSDLRQVYCAFAISSILGDWSGMDVDSAIGYIRKCMSYEGGYGQSPNGEALGGTTYCALASLYLAPQALTLISTYINNTERLRTIQWLLQNQTPSGGFCGRTNKVADACYCFWSGASLHILGANEFVDSDALTSFLAGCQFKFGGLAKAPGDRPDPYHTYMSIAALSMYPPSGADPSWSVAKLDPLWNTTEETAQWIRDHLHRRD